MAMRALPLFRFVGLTAAKASFYSAGPRASGAARPDLVER